MLSFLFENYGYYPKHIHNNQFKIEGWQFKLIETEYNEDYLGEIERYLEIIRKKLDGKGSFIIKTREGRRLSTYDNKKYALISACDYSLTMKDLNKMHCELMEMGKKVDLNKLLESWKERLNYAESIGINSLRIDSVYYKNNLEVSLFCLGLAQNAIQYLSEIILEYGNVLENLSLAHKRLKNLNSFDIFNPFNMIVDHPIKDWNELYKNNYLSFVELIDILKYYSIDSKEASVFVSRLLYPSSVFDELENFSDNKQNSEKIIFNIEKEMEKIRKVYLYMKSQFNIRPIDWLEN